MPVPHWKSRRIVLALLVSSAFPAQADKLMPLPPRPNQDDGLVTKTYPASPIFAKGTLVFCSLPHIPEMNKVDNGPWRYSIVVEKFDAAGKLVTKTEFPFAVDDYQRISDVQLSPDQKTVLFKFWSSNQNNSFNFILLNLKTGKFKPGPSQTLQSSWLSFSPDSRKIAYIDDSVYPHLLSNYDIGNGKITRIHDHVDDFTWDGLGNLIYSSSLGNGRVYRYVSSIRKPVLLLRGASDFAPSADGQWLAFVGSANNEDIKANSTISSFIVNLKTLERFRLSVFTRTRPDWVWAPSGAALFLLKKVPSPTGCTKALWAIDLETQKRRLIGTLTAKNLQLNLMNPPTISGLSMSGDQHYLYLSTTQPFLKTDSHFLGNTTSLRAMDLKTGALKTAVELQNVGGLDWRPGR